jgi:hypothetical protein
MSALYTTRIEWRGIGIQLEFHANRWNSPVDHIEIRSDNRVPLPITETGYKSHFLPAGQVTAETLIEAVTAWLDVEAQSDAWKRYEEASRQLSLF